MTKVSSSWMRVGDFVPVPVILLVISNKEVLQMSGGPRTELLRTLES